MTGTPRATLRVAGVLVTLPASFETTTCAYHAFFEKRDVAFLTNTTCCSLDVEVWFGNVNEPTARVELAESKANGDARCRVRVRTSRE